MRANTCHPKWLCEYWSYSCSSCGRKMCCRGDGSCGFVLVKTLMLLVCNVHSLEPCWVFQGFFFWQKSTLLSCCDRPYLRWCEFFKFLFIFFFPLNKTLDTEMYLKICADKADTIQHVAVCRFNKVWAKGGFVISLYKQSFASALDE